MNANEDMMIAHAEDGSESLSKEQRYRRAYEEAERGNTFVQ